MLTRSRLCVAAALAGMMMVASANAVTVAFSFETNSVANKPLFTYFTNGVEPDTFAVTAGTTNVDLTAEILGGAPSVDFDDAKFTLQSTVTGVSFDSSVGRFVFNLAGTFAFTTSADVAIVSGSFDMGKLNVRATSLGGGKYKVVAGESFFSFATDGTLYTSSGPALAPVIGAQTLSGSQTMHFTALGITESDPFGDIGSDITIMETVAGQVFDVLDDFSFNSSYSGTSELVPEPASIGLGVLGLIVLARRRKV